MKVSGGLIGITLNPNARTKYFLIAPQLARLAEQAKEMAGTSSKKRKHHDATTSVRTRQEKNIEQLVDCIKCFTNPFSEESDDLFNLVTSGHAGEGEGRSLSAVCYRKHDVVPLHRRQDLVKQVCHLKVQFCTLNHDTCVW